MKRRGLLIAGFVAPSILGALLLIPGRQGAQKASSERWASTGLLSLADAQESFRSKKLGEDSKEGYWRKDVAGLLVLEHAGAPINLISIELASADANRVVNSKRLGEPVDYHGYWFKAIGFTKEEAASPNTFVICAYPMEYGNEGTRLTFVVNQNRKVYAKDLGQGEGIDTFSTDPSADGWELLN